MGQIHKQPVIFGTAPGHAPFSSSAIMGASGCLLVLIFCGSVMGFLGSFLFFQFHAGRAVIIAEIATCLLIAVTVGAFSVSSWVPRGMNSRWGRRIRTAIDLFEAKHPALMEIAMAQSVQSMGMYGPSSMFRSRVVSFPSGGQSQERLAELAATIRTGQFPPPYWTGIFAPQLGVYFLCQGFIYAAMGSFLDFGFSESAATEKASLSPMFHQLATLCLGIAILGGLLLLAGIACLIGFRRTKHSVVAGLKAGSGQMAHKDASSR